MASIPNRSDYATPYAFEPTGGTSLTASTTTGRVALPVVPGDQAIISNTGTVWVYVCFGDVTVEATTSRLAIPPSSQVIVTVPFQAGSNETNRATYIAAITASSTAFVQVERGLGV
jgi:hypothetical protein